MPSGSSMSRKSESSWRFRWVRFATAAAAISSGVVTILTLLDVPPSVCRMAASEGRSGRIRLLMSGSFGHEVEVKAWVVVEHQRTPHAVALAPDDTERGHEALDREVPLESSGVPYGLP